jgi:integrase/recombinase XerD
LSGTVVLRERWPVFGRPEQAAMWLQIWTDIATPAGPTPRQLDPPGSATILPIIEVRQAQAGSI